MVYNPSPTHTLTVTYQEGGSGLTQTLTVQPRKTERTEILDSNMGTHLSASSNFMALSITDTDSETHGMIYDWGFPIQPIEDLTARVLVGWGYVSCCFLLMFVHLHYFFLTF